MRTLCLLAMDWLWRGLFSNWVAYAVIIGVGAVLTFLRVKRPHWLNAVMYGLGGAALIAVIWVCAAGLAAVPRPLPQTTAENVEARIREWTDTFGLSVRKERAEPGVYFVLVANLRNGTPVYISRAKAMDGYLQLQAALSLSQEHQAIVSRLSKGQALRISQELMQEMARFKIGFSLSGVPLQQIRVTRSVPITASLTEETFARNLDEVDSAVMLAKATVSLALEDITPPSKPVRLKEQ